MQQLLPPKSSGGAQARLNTRHYFDSGTCGPLGAGGGPAGAPGGAAGPGNVPVASDPGGGGTSLADAVQSMGLKLESRKATVDQLVVDHLEKTPTEN